MTPLRDAVAGPLQLFRADCCPLLHWQFKYLLVCGFLVGSGCGDGDYGRCRPLAARVAVLWPHMESSGARPSLYAAFFSLHSSAGSPPWLQPLTPKLQRTIEAVAAFAATACSNLRSPT